MRLNYIHQTKILCLINKERFSFGSTSKSIVTQSRVADYLPRLKPTCRERLLKLFNDEMCIIMQVEKLRVRMRPQPIYYCLKYIINNGM